MIESASGPQPPIAARRPVIRRHHGEEVVDDYEWLRDKESGEVLAHLAADNAYTEECLAGIQPLCDRLVAEIRERTQETDISVPVRQGDWWYFSRTAQGQQYSVRCRVPAQSGRRSVGEWEPPVVEPGVTLAGEEILLDGNAEAAGHEFFSLGSFDISDDGGLLLYGIDTVGDERYTLRLRDLTTGTDLPDVIAGTFPGAVLTPDGAWLFYITVDDAWRPEKVWLHRVGADPAEDTMVFHEADERFWIDVGISRSRRFVQIEVASKTTSETWLIEAGAPKSTPQVVWPRRDGVEYSVEHIAMAASEDPWRCQDELAICHNIGAKDFEVVRVPWQGTGPAPAAAQGHVVVPHVPGRRIEGVDAFETFVAVSYRRAALPRVALAGLGKTVEPGDGQASGYAGDAAAANPAAGRSRPWELREITFGGELSSVELSSNPGFDQPFVRVAHRSFVRPVAIYDVPTETGEPVLRKRQPVLGGYDPDDYIERRQWVTASDGARIPVSLVWRRDAVTLSENGRPGQPAPALLYGYGAYETSVDPTFSIPRISLLDRGMVYAVAHVRGGGELGRTWYEEGKESAKGNTFTDYVAVARELIRAGWTAPDRLVARGASAGGLLVGAATNLAPELFAGVLAVVPFVDPLTSILDPSLPLTITEWEEWGDPLHSAEIYRIMRGYSPYENVPVDARHYPAVLATTSLQDTRVLYVEPAKWIARLRAAGAPVLLRVQMNAGHGGVSGRYDQWGEIARENAWLLHVAQSAASFRENLCRTSVPIDPGIN